MNLLDAARLIARNYPGGVETLAGRLFKSGKTLDKEVRGAPGFKLGAEDAVEMVRMAQEFGMPEALMFCTALASQLGCLLLPLPSGRALSGDDCMRAVAEASREMHDLMTEVMQSLADGSVSDNERRRVERAGAELVASVQGLLQLMAERNEAGRPPEAA